MATLEQESKLRESVKTILNDILSKISRGHELYALI